MLLSWLDLVVLVILLVFIGIGLKNGLIRMSFRLLSFVAALLLAWMGYPAVASLLKKTPLYERLFSSAEESVANATGVSGETMAEGLQNIWQQGTHAISEYFAQMMMNVIAFLLVLVVARVLLIFAKKILHFVASLPVIGFFNRLGGMALGLLEGLLVVSVVLTVLYVVPPLRNHKPLSYAIEQSIITRSMYIHNPILNILSPKTEKEVLDNEKME